MWARRQAEQKLAEAAREYPEMAAREMLPPDSASEPNASFVPHFKNGKGSFIPGTNIPTLTVVAIR
jgi:hypothetical protein